MFAPFLYCAFITTQERASSMVSFALLGGINGGSRSNVVFIRGGRKIYEAPGDALGPYVEKWHGFAGARAGKLLSISDAGIKDLGALRALDHSEAFGVSPDGKNLLELLENTDELRLIRLKDSKVLWTSDPGKLARKRLPVMVSQIPHHSIVFSNDGNKVAVALPSAGKPDFGGARPPCTVVFDTRTGQGRYEGMGVPVLFSGHKIVKMVASLKRTGGQVLGTIGRVRVRPGFVWAGNSRGIWTTPRAETKKPLFWWSQHANSPTVLTQDLHLGAGFLIDSFEVSW
jgi:hypothetical protein